MRIQPRTLCVVCLPALVIAGAGVTTLGIRQAKAVSPAEKPASPTAAGVKVRAVRPRQGGLEWSVTRPASIHAFHRAALFAKVSGFLQHQVVDIGDVVEKGALLAEVYAPEIVAGVEKAKAGVTKAEALVEVAKARIKESDFEVGEARARLAERQAELKSAAALLTLRQEQYDRIANLAKQKAIEEELVDEKYAARDAAEAAKISAERAVSTSEAAVASAEARVIRSKADLATAQAEVELAKAALAQAAALEEYTRIRSPYKGVITARTFHNGDFIRDAASGETEPVLAVAETELMRVIVWVPDVVVPYTHRGNKVLIHVDALDGRKFEGVVARTAMSQDYDTRTMRIEIDLHNADGVLQDGMYGSATIRLGRRKDAVSIPSTCLLGDPDGERAVYVIRDGRARRVSVRVGREDGIEAEVLSGLSVKDLVIEEHGPGLGDGEAVQIVSTEPESKAVEQDNSAGEEPATGSETGQDEKDSRRKSR